MHGNLMVKFRPPVAENGVREFRVLSKDGALLMHGPINQDTRKDIKNAFYGISLLGTKKKVEDGTLVIKIKNKEDLKLFTESARKESPGKTRPFIENVGAGALFGISVFAVSAFISMNSFVKDGKNLTGMMAGSLLEGAGAFWLFSHGSKLFENILATGAIVLAAEHIFPALENVSRGIVRGVAAVAAVELNNLWDRVFENKLEAVSKLAGAEGVKLPN